jgi:hypothetical protein
MSSADNSSRKKDSFSGQELKKLSLEQIRRIDSLLASLGDYGEIHLIVQHGELRYINKVESYKAWKDDDQKPEERK